VQTTQAVESTHNSMKQALKIAADFDHRPLYELDRKLKANAALLEEFKADPHGIAHREVEVEVPQGFHLHFVDENNNYHPPEGDAVSQLQAGKHKHAWSRVEIRSAVGPGCVIVCGHCMD
jgi:hypothetical protein